MLSGLDYYYLMQELQILKKARLTKIYQDDEQREVFLFEFHVPGEGTKWLQMIVPEVMYLTEQKITPASPPGYCQFLRKKIQGMIIQNVGMMSFERIIKFELGTREEVHFKLYVEMFSKGNMILTDNNDKIVGTWKTKEYGSRSVRGGTEYVLPPSLHNTPELKENELKELLSLNDKSLVVFLARNLGLGGYYSELLLEEAKIDKELKNLSDSQIKLLHKELMNLFTKKINPQIDKDPRPFGGEDEFDNFSQALEKHHKEQIFIQKKDNTKERIAEAQKEKIKEFEIAAVENQKIGEAIYENYVRLQKILSDAKKGIFEGCEKIENRKIKVKL